MLLVSELYGIKLSLKGDIAGHLLVIFGLYFGNFNIREKLKKNLLNKWLYLDVLIFIFKN